MRNFTISRVESIHSSHYHISRRVTGHRACVSFLLASRLLGTQAARYRASRSLHGMEKQKLAGRKKRKRIVVARMNPTCLVIYAQRYRDSLLSLVLPPMSRPLASAFPPVQPLVYPFTLLKLPHWPRECNG